MFMYLTFLETIGQIKTLFYSMNIGDDPQISNVLLKSFTLLLSPFDEAPRVIVRKKNFFDPLKKMTNPFDVLRIIF